MPRQPRSPWPLTPIALSLALCAALASPAAAQYNVPSQATGEAQTLMIAGDPRPAVVPDEPLGWELGASLDFLMREGAAQLAALKFTDAVFFRVHGLVALGKRTELFAGVDLLPKQPSSTDELIVQSGLVGVRTGLGNKLSAYARAQGGAGLERDGSWVMGEAAAQARLSLAENVLYWENTLGATHTQLFPDAAERRRLWQTELLAQTGIAIRDKRGQFATWLSFGFHFPLVGRPLPSAPDPVTGRSLDPQVRIDVSLGMLVGVNRGLDLFIEASILDRGDVEDPRTTLPILSGGSDQKRLVFGFNRRFGSRRR